MKKFYVNKATRERTENHTQAVEWYRAGYEVEIWSWSDVCQKNIIRLEWVHE